MEKMAEVLGRAGAWCGQNKYLSAIKNAFQTFMPLTIAGAAAVLWCNVLVHAETGLGAFWSPVMALEFLNPAFEAIQFATISCITVGITFGVAQEIGMWNMGSDKAGYIPGILGLASWLAVTQNSFDLGSGITFNGISGDALGATGLFTGMIIAVLSIEMFCALSKMEALKIKMPDTVPPGVARGFEVLVPSFLTLTIISLIGLACYNLTNGLYLNDIIAVFIQGPLGALGATLPGVAIIYILIMLFWLVGIHGNNMLAAVKESLFTPLMLENLDNFSNQEPAEHIFTMVWLQMFGEFGGSGVTLGLVISIFIFSKREDNRAVATLSLVPGLFNINETVTFGIPMVLNPILGIPFVIAPLVTMSVGYILTVIGFSPLTVLTVPWTTPPILMGFLATGASIMGAIAQLIAIIASVLVYAPFLIIYEKQQNKEAAQAK